MEKIKKIQNRYLIDIDVIGFKEEYKENKKILLDNLLNMPLINTFTYTKLDSFIPGIENDSIEISEHLNDSVIIVFKENTSFNKVLSTAITLTNNYINCGLLIQGAITLGDFEYCKVPKMLFGEKYFWAEKYMHDYPIAFYVDGDILKFEIENCYKINEFVIKQESVHIINYFKCPNFECENFLLLLNKYFTRATNEQKIQKYSLMMKILGDFNCEINNLSVVIQQLRMNVKNFSCEAEVKDKLIQILDDFKKNFYKP